MKTRAFITKAEADAVSERLSVQMKGWQVGVHPSPDEPEAWGIRADKTISDINERSIPGAVGHSTHVWLRANGTVTVPEENHADETDCVAALVAQGA